MKIFLFNGPPSSGKDTLKNHLVQKYPEFISESLATPLKLANYEIYGISEAMFKHIDTDPVAKNTKIPELFGNSWREVCIDLAENYLKPRYGKSVFAKLLAQRLDHLKFSNVNILVSDLGFDEEVDELINRFGKESVFVIKIERNGCDYSIDSRNYINTQMRQVSEFWLKNDQLDQYLIDGEKLVFELLGK